MLLTSFVIWVFAQTTLISQGIEVIANVTHASEHGITLGLPFNRLGWQFIYFVGLVTGFLIAKERLNLGFMSTPSGYSLFIASLAISLIFLATRINFPYLEPETRTLLHETLYYRPNLSPMRLLNFASDTYLVVWLLSLGQTRSWTVRASKALRALMSWRPLVFLGRHSLVVFTFHVLVAYLCSFFLSERVVGTSPVLRVLITSLLIGSLFVAAYGDKTFKEAMHRRSQARAARPKA